MFFITKCKSHKVHLVIYKNKQESFCKLMVMSVSIFRCQSGMYLYDALLLYGCSYYICHYFLIFRVDYYKMDRGVLRKNLTHKENQAYLGAYDFYRVAIPSVIFIAIAGHVAGMVLTKQEKQPKQEKLSILSLLLLGTITIASYIFSLKFYIKCNEIDTTPIITQNIPLQLQQTINQIDLQDNVLISKKPQKHYCPICKITCDYRTRHCRKCQVCIQRYDHHCFWIGNCVGRHNHRQFYFFLFTQTINNICLFLLINLLPSVSGWKYWIKLGGILLSLGFCCFTGYLLIYHTMLISCGITTWQHMRRSKITYLKYLPSGYNPFSEGIIQNWKRFMTEQTRVIGSQQSQEWEERIINFDDAKTLKPGFNIIQNEYYSCC